LVNRTNGASPGGLLLISGDSFYGATSGGGTNGNNGTIFRMPSDGSVVTLVSFSGSNGAYLGTSPSQLAKGNDGNFYGTTSSGGVNDGTNSYGTVFKMTPDGTFSTLLSVTGTNAPYLGANPGPLIQGSDGNFYGTTHSGGSTNHFNNFGNGYSYGYGTVFQMSTDGVFNTLFLFTGTNGAYLGRKPLGGLIQAADGNLYGTSEAGGTNGDNGTVFRITTNGILIWSFSFANTNGADPQAGLVQGTDGNLYGVTSTYATTKQGSPVGNTIFSITTNGTLTTLNHLAGSSIPNPVAVLIQGNDGNFYGTTLQGGTGIGTVFKVIPSGAVSKLYSFTGATNSGKFPFGGLVQASNNTFYGTASSGGAYTNGIIYQLSIPLPPVLQAPTLMQPDGTYILTWSALAFQTYQLEYSTNLNSTNWINLGNTATATNGIMNIIAFLSRAFLSYYGVVLIRNSF
jgi:uncharacterized repeat protein (TIGR03803 family)